MAIDYRGEKFSGYNKPKRTSGKNKKFAVLAKQGSTVRLIRYGDPNMSIKKDQPKSKLKLNNLRLTVRPLVGNEQYRLSFGCSFRPWMMSMSGSQLCRRRMIIMNVTDKLDQMMVMLKHVLGDERT